MQYLPIYPEKNWDQTTLGYDYWGPAGESMPVTNSFLNFANAASQHARAAEDPITWGTDVLYGTTSLLAAPIFGPITDAVGNVGNYAYNGYKRLYNYGANAYNNIADRYNNWAMQRANPQTSLTGRRITPAMAPVMPQAPEVVATEVPQPQKYLYSNGKIQAKIVEPPVYKYSTGMPTVALPAKAAAPSAKQEAKRLVTNELRRLNAAGELLKNVSRTQKLINLYKKLK